MKRWKLLTGVIVGLLIMLISITAIIQSKKQEQLLITPPTVSGINYNNYMAENCVDCRDGRFAWVTSSLLGSYLTVQDSTGHCVQVDSVGAPFQLFNDKVVFIKESPLSIINIHNKLQIKDIASGESQTIAKQVSRFFVYQDIIIYGTFGDDSALHLYDTNENIDRTLFTGSFIPTFYIHRDALYVIDEEGWLTEISLTGDEPKRLTQIDIPFYSFNPQPLEDDLVYMSGSRLVFFNFNTGKQRVVSIRDSSYVNDRTHLICDDNRAFVSFQATKTNGSIVTNTEDDANGLWAVDPVTLEKKKLCDDVFDVLNLFEGDLLIGKKDGQLYSIDTQTGQVTRITK